MEYQNSAVAEPPDPPGELGVRENHPRRFVLPRPFLSTNLGAVCFGGWSRALTTISEASEALLRASWLLAKDATEDAEAVLQRCVRVEDYEDGEV